MEKFIKQNWFKIIALFVMLIISLSVAYYFIIFLPQEHSRELILSTQENLTENQADCYKMEQSILKKQGVYSNIEVDVQNHYNTKLNKCFVELTDTSIIAGINTTSNDYSLYDAIEDKGIAECTIETGKYANPPACFDYSNSQRDQQGTPITKIQFDSLVNQYMSN